MVLAELTRFFTEHQVRHALAGGVALHALGSSRATQDLDFAVDELARGELLLHLANLGYEKLHESEGFSNHLHRSPAWGHVDLIYLEGRTAELIFGGARPALVFKAMSAPVPRPEHLVAMKTQAMHDRPSRMAKDLADVAFLLTLPGIDEAEMRRYFERYGLASRFDELVHQRRSP